MVVVFVGALLYALSWFLVGSVAPGGVDVDVSELGCCLGYKV
jgi:hypothetical protein